MKKHHIYTAISLLMITLAAYSLSTTAHITVNISGDSSTTEIIALFFNALTTLATVAAVIIAYIAYKQWHKPTTYIELIKDRTELLKKTQEIYRLTNQGVKEIRLYILYAIDIFSDKEENEKIYDDSKSTEMDFSLKRISSDSKKVNRLIIECLYDHELLFHKTSDDLSKTLDDFLKDYISANRQVEMATELCSESLNDNTDINVGYAAKALENIKQELNTHIRAECDREYYYPDLIKENIENEIYSFKKESNVMLKNIKKWLMLKHQQD